MQLKYLTGHQAREYFTDIAMMRINNFKEFPYLYEGCLEYEKPYLEIYFASANSRIILAIDGNEIVAFSSAIPLDEELSEIKNPFGDGAADSLYIGEVIIKPAYRGKGILRQFFEYYDSYAKETGKNKLIFMTVNRPQNHKMRPADYRPLEPVWQHFGYEIIPDIKIRMTWQQSDTHKEEENTLDVWVKNIT